MTASLPAQLQTFFRQVKQLRAQFMEHPISKLLGLSSVGAELVRTSQEAPQMFANQYRAFVSTVVVFVVESSFARSGSSNTEWLLGFLLPE